MKDIILVHPSVGGARGRSKYSTPTTVTKKIDCQRSMLFNPSQPSPLSDDLYIPTSYELEDEGVAE